MHNQFFYLTFSRKTLCRIWKLNLLLNTLYSPLVSIFFIFGQAFGSRFCKSLFVAANAYRIMKDIIFQTQLIMNTFIFCLKINILLQKLISYRIHCVVRNVYSVFDISLEAFSVVDIGCSRVKVVDSHGWPFLLK